MKPLKICIVSRRFPLMDSSGEVSFLWPIARGLVRAGHQVTVLSWTNRRQMAFVERDGVKAYFLGEQPGARPDEFSDLAHRYFQELHELEPFDVVHCLDNSGLKIGKDRKNLNVAVVYDVDATSLPAVYSLLGMAQETAMSMIRTSLRVAYLFTQNYLRHDRKVLKTADAIIVHSPQQRMLLERYYLYPDQRIFFVPFGIEVEDLSPRSKSEELMKRLGLPANAQSVVTISDMNELGEMQNLLWAFERVAIKKNNAYLIVVGSGPLKKEIEAEMLRLALGSRVVFVGEVHPSQVSDYVVLADAFVNLSARSSGLEQSLLEAMAQRKLIIGSELSPISTVVEDGVDGFLIRPADTFTLSELLLQTFNGQIPVESMGEQARQKVMKLFDSKNMLDKTLEAYNHACERFATARRPLFSLARPHRSH